MKLNKIMLGAGVLAVSAAPLMAQDMTIVSWGGAYSASQQNAY
ncbi:MAG: ABC transporter substrate-binding protein, partial [Rhodobacteraceae bacterium]|nr:ABC transporter substrate-binding protein [Paracoccaceae bacterium]